MIHLVTLPGVQAGEGVSVRALNFKQLQTLLSCAGDKKLNEVRLCLEGECDAITI